ncbi:NUDIX hydrolase domain-like protein [Crucibulum laeve]|uniref:NUDIX hydrolase domain-like protein n=1 Tax=Crucibulum laeve TaxID=68775 RepID=A0A5C3M1R2_9AGAR|nr:NUDIX hydrolase domain-like protein [Crucibulum laeve]
MNLTNLPELSSTALDSLSPYTRACIERLQEYFRATERVDLTPYPRTRLAAVLVLLYEEEGKLRVVLTTRSKELRTHPGKTALPGGKVDDEDADLVMTAYREASEEIHLPSSPQIHTLGLLEPFPFFKLLVTPVVAVLTDPSSVLPQLKPNEGEVDRIFSYPLEGVLDPNLAREESELVPLGSEDWPFEEEFHNWSDYIVSKLGNTTYRMHRFRTCASNINGLTADILTATAEIAYAKTTVYERYAPDQPRDYKTVLGAVELQGETGS